VIYRYLDCGDLHNEFARVKYKALHSPTKGAVFNWQSSMLIPHPF
jgi:hypothetical protein